MRATTGVGLVLLFGVAACGGSPSATLPISTATVPPAPAAAPAAWASFPVDRHPRPIVLVSPPPDLAGFSTGEAKEAALSGNYRPPAALPATPPTVTAQLPDGPAEFRTLPAEEALARLCGAGTATKSTQTLPILRVELGTAEFGTDRGRIALPAWLFHAADALGPIAWPALPDEAYWAPDAPLGHAPDARLNPDGALTVSLPAPGPPCPGEQELRYEPVVSESVTTVSVTVRSDSPRPTGDCPRDMMLRYQEHQIRLAAPLGNRVLLDGQGAVFPVTR